MNYYITESRPNGTADLIITDKDGTVIGSMTEAVFWPTTNRDREDLCFISPCNTKVFEDDGDPIPGIEADFIAEFGVWRVEFEDVCKFLAISPTRSGSVAAELLVRAKHGEHV